jgi:hypothetical protein
MSQLDYVCDTIEADGFDTTFTNSEFENIEDPEFQRLREEYVAAREALADYLGVD